MVYLICTEDKNRDGVEAILNRVFDGYTIIPSHGHWKGKAEAAITISIVPPRHLSETAADVVLEEVVAAIKKLNNQESVLLLALPGQAFFI